jgi:hypothetical protein
VDVGRRPRRFQYQGLPSHTDPDEPSLYDDVRSVPSSLSQDEVIHIVGPWNGLGGGPPA